MRKAAYAVMMVGLALIVSGISFAQGQRFLAEVIALNNSSKDSFKTNHKSTGLGC